jgi:hypothetical protein
MKALLILSTLLLISCATTPIICIGNTVYESMDGVAVKWTGVKCEIKCEVK